MWPAILEVKETRTAPTLSLIDDFTPEALMVYLHQDYKSIRLMKKEVDYIIKGRNITIISPIVKAGDRILIFELYARQRELLYYAEVLFKAAFAMHTPNPPERFQYLDVFSWGKHIANRDELILSKEEEELAIALFQHIATYTLVNQINVCLERIYGKYRFDHEDKDIRDASCIVYLIRNSYAHDPYSPCWLIDRGKPQCRNKVLSVRDIIELDTTRLNGKAVDRYDYGGPLAVLRLSEYVRNNLAKTPLSS